MRPLLQQPVTDVQTILETLQNGISDSCVGMGKAELPLPLASALLVLSVRSGAELPTSSPWALPPLSRVLPYIRTHLSDTLEPAELDKLVARDSLEHVSVERLSAKLKVCVDKADEAGIQRVWDDYRDRLGLTTTTTTIGDLRKREEILARILSAALRCERNRKSATLRSTIADITAAASTPLPTPVLNVLLAHRANADEGDLHANGEEDAGDGPAADEVQTQKPALAALHRTWHQAKVQGAVRDLRSYMVFMEGLGRSGDIDGLQAAWAELQADEGCRKANDHEASFPPIVTFNHMLSCAFLVGKTGPPVALALFDRALNDSKATPVNIVTINTVLRHHARMADIPSMNALFSLAAKRNLQPDVVTYTTLVQGLLRAGKVEIAKTVLSKMVSQGLEPNERLCSLLVADLARSGSQVGLQRAEEMIAEMRRKGMRVSTVTWTSLVSGYFRGGWDQDAWAALARMERSGERLNRVAYNMIFKQGRGNWIIKMFERMIKDGIHPNSDTFVILLTPLVASKQWDLADQVVAELRRIDLRLDKGALRRLISRVEARR